MKPAIYYAAPPRDSNGGEIVGLHVAIDGWLHHWFRHSRAEHFACRPGTPDSFARFQEIAAQAGVAPERCVLLPPQQPTSLEEYGLVFRPDPNVADLLWKRTQLTGRGFALCGLAHTMSGERAGNVLNEWLLAPSMAGDAIICPSPAIREAIRALWDIYSSYLNHRFGGQYTPVIDLPIIPLGVDTTHFSRITAPHIRQQARSALGIAADEVVVLFVGRLSFATKAHPLPLLQAYAAAAAEARREGLALRLVFYGYFLPAEMEGFFRRLVADIAPETRVDFVLNTDPRLPHGPWALGDIFVSLADNIQESFGLTPVEALACGLPAIVSDWNGYRSSIDNGSDGITIPTLMPPPGSGLSVGARYHNELENYGEYIGAVAMTTALDTAMLRQAILELARQPEWRRNMGQAGRRKAEAIYDWSVIIPQYEALWDELAARRAQAAAATPVGWPAVHPAHYDPYTVFAGFPTRHLEEEDVIQLAMLPADMETVLRHEMNIFAARILMPVRDMVTLALMAARGRSVAAFVAGYTPAQQATIRRALCWLLKLGICVIRPRHG